MKLKKLTGLLLALTLSASVFASVGTNIAATADELPEQTETTDPVKFTTKNATLHLPETYEQYLPLKSPSYAAFRGDVIAVADESYLYTYDKESGVYNCYQHTFGTGNSPQNISKLQFDSSGSLYYSAGAYLYRFNIAEQKKESLGIACSTFLFAEGYLYTVQQTNDDRMMIIARMPEDEISLENAQEIHTGEFLNTPYLAYDDGVLYSADGTNACSYNPTQTSDSSTIDASLSLNKSVRHQQLTSVCFYNEKFYYTTDKEGANDGFYVTDLRGTAKCLISGSGFSSLANCDGKLYCIKGAAVREIVFSEDGSASFAEFEISAASSSHHRLNEAGEAVRTKELVAFADTNNNRISVYDRIEKKYTLIPYPCLEDTEKDSHHIAINKEEKHTELNGDEVTENKIAVSHNESIYEYTLVRTTKSDGTKTTALKTEKESSEPIVTVKTVSQSVQGMTYVYGNCYYVTDLLGYGTLQNDVDGLTFNDTTLPSECTITSDVYGTIYVAFSNKIYAFEESDFLGEKASGAPLSFSPLSSDSDPVYSSLTVDYEGNVWHLEKETGKLYCNNQVKAQIDGNDFVYTGKDKKPEYPVSFALCFEDDEIYFNFKNYVVKTNAYEFESLPSLNKILAGEAKYKTFDLADCKKLYVKVPAGSVGFQIDLNKLKSDTGEHSEYFPYESYFRLKHETAGGTEIIYRQGALLYDPQDEDGYYVVALYDVNSHSFTANLFKKSKKYYDGETELRIEYYNEEENHFQAADEGETGYISSNVSLCSSPCLFIAPDGERLSPLSDYLMERGTKVNVLGYADGEDREYAFVEVVSRERISRQGFVPRSYLTKNNPLGLDEKNFQLGYLKGDAGIILKGENGEELLITEKTEAMLYKNEDGTYIAVVEKDGVLYSSNVLSEQISRGETDALRISLIVILSVLALVIIAGYAFLMFPRKKK